MTLYRFNPTEMDAFAADLRRAALNAGAASLALCSVDGYGLPPEAKPIVEDQARALSRLLSAGDTALIGGARFLTQMAAAVHHADRPTLRAAGLDLVKLTDSGEILAKEVSDRSNHTPAALDKRSRRWARILGNATGSTAITLAVSWAEWRAAVVKADVDPKSPVTKKISEVLRTRAQSNLDEIRPPRHPDLPLDRYRWKQWSRRLAGLLPSVAGDTADAVSYVAASRKLHHDEPQTGLAQAATDVRDFVDLVAASNHLAADIEMKVPILAPAAPINEAIGLGADGVVLALDTANVVRKGVGHVVDHTVDHVIDPTLDHIRNKLRSMVPRL